MTLWRLEWLRLVRTRRLWIVVGVYALFGVVGPFSARYLPEIIDRFGGGVKIEVPEPVPADGISQFLANAGQLGLLAVLAVAAGALAFDARPEWSAFLRTRTPTMRRLVVPRIAVPALGAVFALVSGTVIAAVLTTILIGGLPIGDLVLGTLFGALYLCFAVSVVAVAASVSRQVLSIVLLSVAVLVVLPILQVVGAIEPWLPSKLLGATTALLGGASLTTLLKATAVTLVAVPVLLAVAIHRLAQREHG